jgi:RNA polymerase sigma-70 factor (sigma-E family)
MSCAGSDAKVKPPPQGFAEFVAARGDELRRFAYLLCGDPHTAEDLVQVALVKVLPRWESISARGSVDGYVRTVIINAQRSAWRRMSAKEQPSSHLPDRSQSDETSRVDDADLLGRALSRLPAGQRAAVILRFYEDRSELETAMILGCSTGTVKSQTHRGLSSLRARLEAEATSAQH